MCELCWKFSQNLQFTHKMSITHLIINNEISHLSHLEEHYSVPASVKFDKNGFESLCKCPH